MLISNVMLGQTSLRPYAGVCISKCNFNLEKVTNKFKPALNLGVGVDVLLNNYFSIETGIGYIQKRAGYSYEFLKNGIRHKTTRDQQADYIGLPLMVKMQKKFGT